MQKEELDKITGLRHELHRCAELSMQETQTMERLIAFLKESTELSVVRRDGWFYAVHYGDPGAPAVAIRADMDALPIPETISIPYASANSGVSHKCGHDGHCAALCGLALELGRLQTNKTVYLLFQPGEETGQGALRCRTLLDEAKITEIYAFHNLSGYPPGTVVYRPGLTQPASEGLQIRLYGKTSHAASPEEGVNPAHVLARIVLYAESRARDAQEGMLLCTAAGIELGSGDFGVSPGEGTLSLTLRGESEQEMKRLESDVLSFAAAECAKAGVRLEYALHDVFPQTRNHPESLQRVLCAARNAEIPTLAMPELWRASEDFGYYLQRCPGTMFYIGNGETYPALHTAEYDFNDAILPTAVKIFSAILESD